MLKKVLIVALLSMTYINAQDSGWEDLSEYQDNSSFSSDMSSIEKSSFLNTSDVPSINCDNINISIASKYGMQPVKHIDENEIFKNGTADSIKLGELAQVSKENNSEQNSFAKTCLDCTWNVTKKLAAGTIGTLVLAYVVVPTAVDGIVTLTLSEGIAGKCTRSVLRFFKPAVNYIVTSAINKSFFLKY